MSTHHSSDVASRDSSEVLSAEEAKRQALAERVLGAARKPMSTPKYVALLVTLSLIFGFGSWGIVLGVDALNNPVSQSVQTAQKPKVNSFPEPNSQGVSHFSADLTKGTKYADKEITVYFPHAVSKRNYVLHVHAPASKVKDLRCVLRLESPKMSDDSNALKDYNLVFSGFCPSSDDGSVDFWVPVANTDFSQDNRPSKLVVRGFGVTLNLDLMEFEKGSPVDWDGTSPFKGTGPAFIRTTSGAYKFKFDRSDNFNATVYASQALNYFQSSRIGVSEYSDVLVDSFQYSDGTSQPQPGYIFVFPAVSSMDVPWVLTQVDTGDFPAK